LAGVAAAPAPAAPAPTETSASTFAGKTILIAEDDTMQAANIKQRLAREGLVIDVAVNGQLAVEALQKKSYDLTILDLRMPLLDGFQVLTRIRGDLNLRQMPVIVLSATGNEADIIK